MAIRGAVSLFNSSFVGSSAGPIVQWLGGRSAIVINASAYGGSVFLQLQGPSGTWLNVNASTYSADQITSYDLVPGQYKLVSGQSSSVGVNAVLAGVGYGY